MNKRLLIGAAVSGAVFLTAVGIRLALQPSREPPPPSSTKPQPKPNVLLITLDTTRAGHLGCYGHKTARTPVLDRLAAEGARYTRAYSHVPLTTPSHASLMTGLLPPHHGVRLNGVDRLPPGVPVLAESMKSAGYHTAAFVASFVLDRRFGLDRGFDHYDDRTNSPTETDNLYTAEVRGDVVVDRALAWLNAHAEPAFVWVHLYDPHYPYAPPPGWQPADATPEAAYDAEIAFTDRQVGRLTGWLAEHKLSDRTLVVVAGDHGEAFGEHDEQEHGALVYENTLRVPLLLWRPGTIKPFVCDRVVGLRDVPGTVLDIVGAPRPSGMDATSLLTDRGPNACYGESTMLQYYHNAAPVRCLIQERWKYIESPRPEVYDLSADPSEQHNLIGEQPQQAAAMKAGLSADIASKPQHRSQHAQRDAAAVAALQQLGYLSGLAVSTAPDDSGPDPKDVVRVDTAAEEARRLNRAGSYRQAVASLAPLADRAPRSKSVHAALFEAYQGLGEWAAAYQHATRAMVLEPDNRVYVLWTATALMKLDRLKEAVQLFQHGLRLPAGELEQRAASGVSRMDLTLRVRLGLAYLKSDRPAEAVEQWRLVARADPDNAAALAGALAGVASEQADAGRSENATAAFTASLETSPTQPVAMEFVWRLACTAGQDGQTAVRWALWVQQQQSAADAVSLDTLAAAHARAGDYLQAAQLADRAQQLTADGSPLRSEIGRRRALYLAGKPCGEMPSYIKRTATSRPAENPASQPQNINPR